MKRPEGRAAFVCGLVLLLVLLPFFYVLSVPPAYWLASHGYLSWNIYGLLYAPLAQMAEHWPPLDDFVQWLLEFVPD